MMAEAVSLKTALENGGAYTVWELMSDDDRTEAAAALWQHADPESRAALEVSLAKDLKFRPRSIRRLPAERIASRLVRMADSLPDAVLFQFLFHLHMAGRRPLMVEFLDSVGLPHEEGVLELEEETAAPTAEVAGPAAAKLLATHEQAALVYLATLKVADGDFWQALDATLDGYGDDGSKLG